jgi:bacterioferritin-associated ferredoxin
MEKCHCSGVKFEKVVETARRENVSFQTAAKSIDVSETCTACRKDMVEYCEVKLGLVKVN